MENRFAGTVEKFSSSTKSAMEAIDEVKQVVGDIGHRLAPYFTREKAREIADRSVRYAKQHPVPVVLVGIGVGLIVSYFLVSKSTTSD